MAEKEADAATKDAEPSDPNEISLEDIDDILSEDDPEFADQMNQMTEDQDLAQAEVEPSGMDESGILKEDEDEERSRAFLERHPKIAKWVQPIEKWKYRLSQFIIRTRNRWMIRVRVVRSYLTHEFKDWVKYQASRLKERIRMLKAFLGRWKKLSRKDKATYVGIALASIAVLGIVQVNVTDRWLPDISRRYIPSLTKVSDKVYTFKTETELEPFYGAFPQPKFTVLMDKIKVNLKRHSGSRNPFGAFQIYVTVDAQETAIEIKDREREMVDRVSRAIEEFTFEELNSIQGKSFVKNAIRETINQALNQGRVSEVYFKLFITHP